MMIDTRTALEEAVGLALEHGVGSGLTRLAPLSTGAILSGALVVGVGAIVKRLLGPRGRRALSLAGVAALLPLAIVLLTPTEAQADASESVKEEEVESGEEE